MNFTDMRSFSKQLIISGLFRPIIYGRIISAPFPMRNHVFFSPNFNTKFPNPASKIKVASETSACEILLILRQKKRE